MATLVIMVQGDVDIETLKDAVRVAVSDLERRGFDVEVEDATPRLETTEK